MTPRNGTRTDAGADDLLAALQAENARLRAALAASGLDAREARAATADAEAATRLARSDAASAASGHAREVAAGRAELADAAALNARLEELNGALRASEERLDAVVESATDHAIIEMDFAGRITGWSPGAERVLGWTAAEAIGLDGAVIWTEEDRAAGVPEGERRVADATGSAADERWHVRRDGARFWGSGHLTPLRNGRPRGYLKVLRDRTAERRAEEALRDSEARFRALAGAIEDVFYMTDLDRGALLYLSPAYERVWGRPAAELLADVSRFPETLHPDDLPARREAQAARLRGEPASVEYRIIRPDGEVRWILDRSFPVRGREGRVTAGVATDITERRRAEAALRESEAGRRIALEGGGMGAWRWDCRARMVRCDPAFLDLWGIPRTDDLVPVSAFTDRMGPEGAAAIEAVMACDQAPGAEVDGEVEVASGPTAGRWVRWRGRAEAERPWIIHGVSFDVTEARRDAARLRASEERGRFLLALGDAMRAAGADANAVVAAAARLLGERLGASRVMFAEFDHGRGVADIFHGWFADGARPFPAVMRLEDYEGPILDDLRAGRTVRVEDAGNPAPGRPDLAAIAELGVKALLSVPLLVGGRLGVNLSVHGHAPRRWTEDEVALVREVAERLRADLARARAEAATRESEARLRLALEVAGLGAWQTDLASGCNLWDARMAELLAVPPGRAAELSGAWLDFVHPEDRDRVGRALRAAAEGGIGFQDEFRVRRLDGAERIFASRAVPVGAGRMIGIDLDVTEARAAEAALRESEAKYRSLFEAMDEGYLLAEVEFDADGKAADILYIEANAAAVRLSGRDFVGRRLREVDPDYEEHWFETYGRVALTGEPVRTELYAAAHGRWFELYVFRPGGPDSRRVAVVFQDTTERRRAEAALRESEARLAEELADARALQRMSTALIPERRPEALYERLVEEAMALMRSDAASVQILDPTGKALLLLASKGFHADAAAHWQEVEAGAASSCGQALRDGQRIVVPDIEACAFMAGTADLDAYRLCGLRAVQSTPLVARDGRPLGMISTHWRAVHHPAEGDFHLFDALARQAADLVERAQAEAALRESEARFRALVEGVPQLLWRSADGGQWSWASPQWSDFTGQAPEAALGLGWLEAVHPDDRAATLAAWQAAPAAGRLEVDHRIRCAADGTWRWHQTRALPVGGPGGEWLGSCTDVEDQMRARAVLARGQEDLQDLVAERTGELERAVAALQHEMADRTAAEEALRQSQKMEALGQLTGGIAHDFNNMLQGVTGALAMARRRIEAGAPDGAARYLDAANDSALRAAGLTRRLLAFARRQRLEPRRVNPDELLAGLVDMVRRSVGPQVAVELRLRDGAGVVRCDPNELESAVVNLCVNARDAVPRGGRLVLATSDVTLSARDVAGQEGARPGDYVEIRVEDTGAGMPPEVLARVTEPFFTTKPAGQGTGLGLSEVYGFVRQSDGVLRVESEVGRGTTVRLLLPRRPGTPGPAEAPAEVALAAADTPGCTVLLVDDEGGVRGPAAERLREIGCTVLEAATGPEALRLLDEGVRPDLLVTDVGLPGGMNGRQVAEAATERLPGLPVLFISGWTGSALPPGIEVIGKPFDLDTLAQRVAALARGQREA